MLPLPLVCALLCLFGAWLCRELRAYYAVPVAARAVARHELPWMSAGCVGVGRYRIGMFVGRV